MANQMNVRNVLSGAHGYFTFNGTPVFEVKEVEAKVEAMREDVLVGMSVDSKLISLKGSGSFVVTYCFDRGLREILEAYKRGEDVRSSIAAGINDPDASGKQRERTVLNNVWLNEMTLMSFVKGEMVNRTIPFGFTPNDAERTEVVA